MWWNGRKDLSMTGVFDLWCEGKSGSEHQVIEVNKIKDSWSFEDLDVSQSKGLIA